MIPQATPLYLVIFFYIDGDPAVVNRQVIGWIDTGSFNQGYEPVTVSLGERPGTINAESTDAKFTETDAVKFGRRFYSTRECDIQDACPHDSVPEGGNVCLVCEAAVA